MSKISEPLFEQIKVSSPFPGDGICPTDSQFDDVSSANFNFWNLLNLEAQENTEPILIADKLLSILQQVPGLVAYPSKSFAILDGHCPLLQYALDLVTTTSQVCEYRIKRTIHHQLLCLPKPRAFEFAEASGAWSPWPGNQVDRNHFSFLILAWTFILSSRWVETLTSAGEETYMKFSENGSIENFWELVAEQQWQASIVRGEKIFFAPWSLMRPDLPQPSYSVHVSPDSSYAFKLLVKFCASERIGQECVAAALAVVLMLPQNTVEIKFPSLSAAPVVTMKSNDPREGRRDKLYKYFGSYKESYYDEIFQCLNQCITMSCTLEGISSLLCAALFDPTVPCNLIGAHLSGIAEVIEPILDDHEAVARLMAKKSPSTSPFWLAAIWTGQAREAVTSALAGMPP